MRTKKEIINKIKELEEDERMGYKRASVFSNAPLALIQLSIQTKIDSLKWTLKERKHMVVG